MKAKLILSSVAALAAASVFAAAPWEDPAVNSINRLPARTFSVPCQTEDLALDIVQHKRPAESSKWVLPLNGTWDFKWKSATAVKDWEKKGKIKVPSCWQLEGEYDPPLYSNHVYPIERDAPRVTREPADKSWTSVRYRNPVGLYTTTFRRPSWRWWLRRTILRFNGVSSAFFVRVNGKDVGYAEDSRLPSEFDLTPYLKWFGENTLEVEVYKHCDGTYLEDQDFWRLSGVARDSYLYSRPKKCISDIRVTPDLDATYTDGSLKVNVTVPSKSTVALSLFDADGASVASTTLTGSGDLSTVFTVPGRLVPVVLMRFKNWRIADMSPQKP